VNDLIVVINAGSATIKFAAYELGDNGIVKRRINRGIGEFVSDGAHFSVVDEHNAVTVNETIATSLSQSSDIQLLMDHVLQWLSENAPRRVVAFGHRVVHGGDAYREPVVVNDSILTKLDTYAALAPLHQPFNLAAIRSIHSLWPDIPQIACFDTAFHQTQPRIARMFGIPLEYFDKGVKRYGFHGLSYEYIAGVLPQYLGNRADDRVIVAHLGGGASLCAMRQRKSVATTMGFTALDGLLMGTRCGTIDPGVILYLMNEEEFDSEQIAGLLYRHSGLLGVSGMSADMRELLASKSPRAADAIDLFVYEAVRQIGGLIATLGGLDALIFTGGIGTHSPMIRQRICEGSAWAGVKMDQEANIAQVPRISSHDNAVSVWVIPTDEERIIASHTASLTANHRATIQALH
jgi:acetate kinase